MRKIINAIRALIFRRAVARHINATLAARGL